MVILFVLVPVAFAAVFAAAWLLAGDLLEGADGVMLGWVYSRIGAGSISATIISRAILRVAEGGIKASIHRSVWEQVFLPVGRGARDMAKVLVDGLFARLSEGMAAIVLYFWLSTVI